MTIYKSSASWPQMLTKKPKLLSWLNWKDGQKNSRTHKLPDFLPETRSVKTAGFLFATLIREGNTQSEAICRQRFYLTHKNQCIKWIFTSMGTVLQDRCVAHIVLVICRVEIFFVVFYFTWLRANRSSSFSSYW